MLELNASMTGLLAAAWAARAIVEICMVRGFIKD